MTPTPSFKGHAIFWRSTSQKRYDIQTECHWNSNRDLHTTYATVSLRMTLSDLAKYSMTRSVARSLCDSWAACYVTDLVCYKCQKWGLNSYGHIPQEVTMHQPSSIRQTSGLVNNSQRQHLEMTPCHCLCPLGLHASSLTVGSVWQLANLQSSWGRFVPCRCLRHTLHATKQTVSYTTDNDNNKHS